MPSRKNLNTLEAKKTPIFAPGHLIREKNTADIGGGPFFVSYHKNVCQTILKTRQLGSINLVQINIEFLEETFHCLYEGLHRYAYSLTGDNEVAKDVVQQVFMNLWERRDRLNISTSVKSYLFRAVHNFCINMHNRTVRHDSIDHLSDDEMSAVAGVQPELLTEIKELQAIIEHTIELLPPHCRLVFKKSREENKSYPTIARELGISPKTVEAQMSKALKNIRSALEKYYATT